MVPAAAHLHQVLAVADGGHQSAGPVRHSTRLFAAADTALHLGELARKYRVYCVGLACTVHVIGHVSGLCVHFAAEDDGIKSYHTHTHTHTLKILAHTDLATRDGRLLLPAEPEHRLPLHAELLLPVQLLAATGDGAFQAVAR